jgi:hypothetical protein
MWLAPKNNLQQDTNYALRHLERQLPDSLIAAESHGGEWSRHHL